MTIDPSARESSTPYVAGPDPFAAAPPSPVPPTGHGTRRRREFARPTAWFVAAIMTFVQSGLALLGGLSTVLTVALWERDSGSEYPWVDSEGNRYEEQSSSYNDDGDLVEVTYDPGVDLPWAELAVVASFTLAAVAILTLLAFMVVRGRRWAVWALAAVQLLAVVGCVLTVIRIASEDEFAAPPGALVGPLLTASLPIAVLVALGVGFVQLRGRRSRPAAEPTHAA